MAKLDKFVINGELGGDSLTVVATIAVESMDEANAVIEAMKASPGKPAKKGETAAAPAPKPGKKKKEPEPEPEEEEEEEPEEEEEEETEEEEEETEEETEEEEEEEEEAPKPAKKGAGKGGASGGTNIKLTPALKGASKLREVLTILIEEQGIKSKKQLLKACVILKDKVPALTRIADLEARVPKAAELIDPNIKD